MSFKKYILFIFFGIICATPLLASGPITEKAYIKEYFSNGNIRAEGWESKEIKNGYWKFYHSNGKLASQGHFENDKKEGYWYYYNTQGSIIKQGHYAQGKATDWWIFHDIAAQTENRYQYLNNQKNGFAIIYKSGNLKRAEKYKNDKKVGEWTSYFAFKRDNPNVSL